MEIDLTKLAHAEREARKGSPAAVAYLEHISPTLAAHKLADAKRLDAAEKMAEALRGIAMGTYDGLEPSYYTAKECRNLARAALSAWDEANGGDRG